MKSCDPRHRVTVAGKDLLRGDLFSVTGLFAHLEGHSFLPGDSGSAAIEHMSHRQWLQQTALQAGVSELKIGAEIALYDHGTVPLRLSTIGAAFQARSSK